MSDETSVGSIIGYLKLDASNWNREISDANRKAGELGRNSPKITISTNAATAIAQLETVAAATKRLQDSQGKLAVSQSKLSELQASGNASEAKLAGAREAVAKATRDQELAEIRLAAAHARVADDGNKVANSQSKVASSSSDATKQVNLLSTAILGLGPALIPVGAVAAGGFLGLVAAATTAALAVKGIQTEMQQGSAIGKQYSNGMDTLKDQLTGLEAIAAHGVLTGFNSAIKSLQPLFPVLNRDVASLSGSLGKVAANVAPGLVAVFRQLNPLFATFGQVLVDGSARFKQWATSSDAVSKFVAYVQNNLPNVEHFIGNVATTIGRLVVAAEPFGSVVLTGLTMFSRAINAIPLPVLQTLVPLLLGLKVGMLGMTVANNAAVSLNAFAAKSAAAGGIAASTAGTVGTLGRAVGFLGPIGLAAGVGLAAFSLFTAHSQQAAQEATKRVNDLTQAIENNKTSTGLLMQLQGNGAVAAADKLGISQTTLINSVLKGGNALATVKDKIAATNQDLIKTQQYLSSTQAELDSTKDPKFFQFQASQARDLSSTMATLSSKLQQAQADYAKAKAAAAQYAASQGDAALAAQVQSGAIDRVAKSYGLSADAYYGAKLAADNQATASQNAAAAMRLESDAGGLLKDALDKLNGKALSAAETQNQFESALVNMAKHTSAADAAVTGLSSSAIKNRGDLLTLVTSAGAAADAFGSMDKSGAKTQQRLIDLKKQIIDNAVANGENRAAVTAYVDSVLKIPPAATTQVDLDQAAAAQKAAAYKAFIASLPKSIQTAVALNGVSTAEYELQLLARNRTAYITTVVGGQGATGVHSVGGKQVATGGFIEGPGTATSDSIPARLSNGEYVINAAQTKKHRGLLDMLNTPGFADGGIVTLTPSKAKTAAAAATTAASHAAAAKAAPAVLAGLSATAGGGEAYGIASYIKGQIPSVAYAARLLGQAVTDAFQLKGIQAKIAAVKADLANLKQEQGTLISTVTSTLSANTDPSQFGSVSDYTAYLQSRTAQNLKYGGEVHTLSKKGLPPGLLAQFAAGGPSAGLDSLAAASPAQLAALSKASAGFNTSVRSGAAQAGGVYAPAIAKDNQNLSKATTQLAAVSNATARLALAIGAYTQHGVTVELDGKTVATTKFVNNQIQGAMNELEHTLITGRR